MLVGRLYDGKQTAVALLRLGVVTMVLQGRYCQEISLVVALPALLREARRHGLVHRRDVGFYPSNGKNGVIVALKVAP